MDYLAVLLPCLLLHCIAAAVLMGKRNMIICKLWLISSFKLQEKKQI